MCMLIKVNTLIYKTIINVKMKLKIKTTYVLIMRVSFIMENRTGKVIKSRL